MTYWTGNSKGEPRTANVTINTAFEAINLTALNWTTEKPTEPGWYWVHFPLDPYRKVECLCIMFDFENKPFDAANIEAELVEIHYEKLYGTGEGEPIGILNGKDLVKK